MNEESKRWAKRYQAALARYLKKGPADSLAAALRLGHRAAALGLETLDVARSHERALLALVLPDGPAKVRQQVIDRSKPFFEETLVPIEQTHAAAKADVRHVAELGEELRARTVESSASTRRLERGVVQRQASEKALKKSGKQHALLLRQSRELQTRLRAQMRKILSTSENKRQQASFQLQNELAQILVAIHVRLLTLKEASLANTDNLKKEIAETQQLVKQSVKTIQRLANESGIHHEA